MNKLYTFLIIVFLMGCTQQRVNYDATGTAFIKMCDHFTIKSNIVTVGDEVTVTATCTKQK